MTPEVHAVILWSTALTATDRIVADLAPSFELAGSYRVEWAPDRFAENLRRLYGFALPERVDKTLGSGTDPFLLLVVRDPAPVYGPRPRSWGTGVANVALYDAKYRYREWTGGGFRVHTTIDRAEADRDLFLLLGRRSASFARVSGLDWERTPDPWRADVLGADGWRSPGELLTALELATGYALLRDPDLLVPGETRWAADLIGAEARHLRMIDEGLLDHRWRRSILREAARDDRGLLVATPEHRFHALLAQSLDGASPVRPAELAGLATEAGAPAGPYDDPIFARAELDDFLQRNGWESAQPRRGRLVRAARGIAARLPRRRG